MNKKIFNCYILCIWPIFWCSSVFAEKNMYKNSIDGIVSFSDRQTPQSEAIKLDNKRNLISTVPTSNLSNFGSQSSSINTDYRVKILNILDEQTFRNIQNLEVRVSVTPPYRFDMGQKLQLLFNSKPIQPAEASGNLFELNDIVRGEHELKAQIVDFEGRLLGESEKFKIYVHKHSILQ